MSCPRATGMNYSTALSCWPSASLYASWVPPSTPRPPSSSFSSSQAFWAPSSSASLRRGPSRCPSSCPTPTALRQGMAASPASPLPPCEPTWGVRRRSLHTAHHTHRDTGTSTLAGAHWRVRGACGHKAGAVFEYGSIEERPPQTARHSLCPCVLQVGTMWTTPLDR